MSTLPGVRVILLSSDVGPNSGWGRFTQEFCRALWRKEVSFELHLPHSAKAPVDLPFYRVIRRDLPPWQSALGRSVWHLGPLWAATRRIVQQLPRSQGRAGSASGADAGVVIHALVEYYGLVARWISKRTGWPFGLTGHGTYTLTPFRLPLDRLWFRRVVREADFVITVSRYTATLLQKATDLPELPAIKVIHPGVDLERFSGFGSQEEARQALGIPPRVPVLLFVGALKSRKGLDVLLRAFASVCEVRPQALLLIVGAGELEHYRPLAVELGVADRVRFLGEVDDEMLQSCYESCDLFVLLPQRVDMAFEGFGMVYLEANAYKKPVLGADSGGVGEAIRHQETGLIVPEGDWVAAAQAILELLGDRVQARRLGEQGRIWAEEHSWDRIIEHYLHVYSDTLGSKPQTCDNAPLR